jgi:hypothetical protein
MEETLEGLRGEVDGHDRKEVINTASDPLWNMDPIQT